MTTKIESIQQALRDRGFNPGEIDGIWGRRTIAAVRAFQTTRGLKVDGVVGPVTASALLGTNVLVAADSAVPLVWYEEAKRLLGTRETPGPASNHKILEWAKDLDISYKGDDVPWCGLFVAHCIGSTLTEESLPANPLSARAWRKVGQSCKPGLGAILVFWRGSPGGALGHVGFYKGEDKNAYHVLGGNQSDRVSVARVAKDRLLEARWPATAALIAPQVIDLKENGSPLSGKEQ